MRKPKFSVGDTVKYSREFVANHPRGEELMEMVGIVQSEEETRSVEGTWNRVDYKYVNVLWVGRTETESVYVAKLQRVKTDKDSTWLNSKHGIVDRFTRICELGRWSNPSIATDEQIGKALSKFTISAKHIESVVQGASTLGGPITISANGCLIVKSGTADSGEYSAELHNGEEWGVSRRNKRGYVKNIVTYTHSGEDVEFQIAPARMLAALDGMRGIVECTVTDKTLLVTGETRAAITRLM